MLAPVLLFDLFPCDYANPCVTVACLKFQRVDRRVQQAGGGDERKADEGAGEEPRAA